MSKIEVGQFSTLLRRYLGMKGVSDVVDELAPEISPVLVLEAERPEWAFLKGERLCAWTQLMPAAGAGIFNAVRMRNPTTSGMVAICSYLNVGVGSPSSTIVVSFGAQTADLATVSGNANRDGRQTPIGGALITSFGTTAPGGNAIDMAFQLAGNTFPFLRGSAVVITPGFAMNVTTSVANVDLIIGVHWLEKRLDDLEAR